MARGLAANGLANHVIVRISGIVHSLARPPGPADDKKFKRFFIIAVVKFGPELS
jgi:hypothetical protein